MATKQSLLDELDRRRTVYLDELKSVEEKLGTVEDRRYRRTLEDRKLQINAVLKEQQWTRRVLRELE